MPDDRLITDAQGVRWAVHQQEPPRLRPVYHAHLASPPAVLLHLLMFRELASGRTRTLEWDRELAALVDAELLVLLQRAD